MIDPFQIFQCLRDGMENFFHHSMRGWGGTLPIAFIRKRMILEGWTQGRDFLPCVLQCPLIRQGVGHIIEISITSVTEHVIRRIAGVTDGQILPIE